MTESVVEVRCPNGVRALLMKIRVDPEGTSRVTTGNLLELSCRDCSQRLRREMGDGRPRRVLHRFDVAGQFVESVQEEL